MSTTHLAINSANKKVKKKRMLSFSNKKKAPSSASTSSNVFEKFSSGSSISSSPTSSTSSSPITTTITQSKLSQIPANNQRLFNTSPSQNTTLNSSSAGSNTTTTTKENENPNDSALNWSKDSNCPQTTSTPSTKHRKVRSSSRTKSFIETHKHENEGSDSSLQHSYTEPRLQLEDLLQIDFGMPFNLFSEFNILHPYLSLYYLDYFTMINKMNTKLYCTTSLMLSMMNAAHTESKEANENNDQQEVGSNTSSMISSSGSSSYSYQTSRPGADPRQAAAAAPKPTIGYTIGATNALFKQRLYDDIDVFVDETSIDIKQNETLKKQLQLSTADLRFADYLIKHVNANRNMQQKNMSHNTPTLLSVKKTSSSFCEIDENTINNPSMLSSANWEGSDEWIRLNFKWYFYSLLGSMVKEDLCNETRYEAENLVSQLMSYDLTQQASYSSSSSSTISLANEVVDIDDYIERASTKTSERGSKKEQGLKSARYSSYSINAEKSSHKNSPKSRKSSIDQSVHSLNPTNSTLVSAQNYLNSTSTSHIAYHDDFNSQYLAEFKKTECYQTWADVNCSRLENNLFKLNEWLDADLKETNNMLSQLSVENTNQTGNYT